MRNHIAERHQRNKHVQCYDYANAGWSRLYPGTSLRGINAKDIAEDNKQLITGRGLIFKNTPSFLAKPGDMVLFPIQFGNGAGHVGWVISATLNSITITEQNWLSGGWTSGNAQGGTGWESVTARTHEYHPNMIFIRPNFKANAVTAAVAKVANKVAAPQTTWNWGGRFYPNTTIKVRRSPSLKGSIVDKGSWLYNKNDWVDFVSITKADGYWWVRFKYPTNPAAGYFYCAITKITDKRQLVKNEKYWGTINWKN